MNDLQTVYKTAFRFAAIKHKNQQVPGTELPYLTHVTNVAMEVIVAGFYTPGKEQFGEPVAEAVLALTKFTNLEKPDQMPDSLHRIKLLEKEVLAVKLGR